MKVDEKIDIYTYGVVLLELLIGKWPSNLEFRELLGIIEWIRRNLRKQISRINIKIQCRKHMHVQEEMFLVLGIAFLYTTKLFKDKPFPRDVVMILGAKL